MTALIHEQLSAWMDSELDAQEAELLLRRLEADPPLCARLERYHIIGEALRRELPAEMDLELAPRVMTALADEHAPILPSKSRTSGWWKSVPVLAIAASLAAVTVLTLRTQPAPTLTPLTAATDLNVPAAAPFVAQTPTHTDIQQASIQQAPAPMQQASAPAEIQADVGQVTEPMLGYLLNHQRYSESTPMPGLLPYVRIVGYEPAQ